MTQRPTLLRFRWYAPLLVVPVPVLVALGLNFKSALDEPDPTYYGSCSAHRAVYLIDLRKPLDPDFEALPGDLLGDVSRNLPADTELGVYAVSPYAEAPRTLLGRLCKPYENGTLDVEAAKDQRGKERDCDDLPAQIPASLRTGATAFCKQREVLRGRIDALAEQVRTRTVTDAYLVEAVEETWRDLADPAVPTSLYVFSDMLQHAAWYSHLDVQWNTSDTDDFATARQTRTRLDGPVAPPGDDHSATVFYVPRDGVTDTPQERIRHKEVWTAFYGGAAIGFEDLPTMTGYAAEQRMNVPTPAELAAYEMERARYTSELVERERTELTASRRALAEQEEQLAEQEEQLAERQRRFEEQQAQFVALQREFDERRAQESTAQVADRN